MHERTGSARWVLPVLGGLAVGLGCSSSNPVLPGPPGGDDASGTQWTGTLHRPSGAGVFTLTYTIQQSGADNFSGPITLTLGDHTLVGTLTGSDAPGAAAVQLLVAPNTAGSTLPTCDIKGSAPPGTVTLTVNEIQTDELSTSYTSCPELVRRAFVGGEVGRLALNKQ
jgi:hypothetical protein